MAKNNQILKEGQGYQPIAAGKGNDTLASRPDNYKPSAALANKPAWLGAKQNNNVDQATPEVPAWATAVDALIGGAMGGAMQNPVLAGAAMGGAMQLNNKPNDTLTQRNPKNFDMLAQRPPMIRSDQLRNAQPNNNNNNFYTGFGSQYGGNWGGGGGGWGGGGGGGWGGGSDSERAAWINYLQGLYSWNIK